LKMDFHFLLLLSVNTQGTSLVDVLRARSTLEAEGGSQSKHKKPPVRVFLEPVSKR
jgi:hypothetical protein